MILEESEPGLELIGFDAGGGDIYHLNGVPYTGVIIFRYDNGNIGSEVSFVDGYVFGVIREYKLNGALGIEYYKKHNRYYGAYTEWDEEGNSTFTDYGPEP